MVKVPNLFLSDEEIGKKNDDHRTDRKGLGATWTPSVQRVILQPRRALKRIGLLAIAVFLVYQFVVNIPTDVPIRDRRRPNYWNPNAGPGNDAWNRPPSAAAPGSKGTQMMTPAQPAEPAQPAKPAEVFSGHDIQFPALSASLHAIAGTGGFNRLNKNVLFAASSLKSVARLLPMACQMGQELRSYVHFVLMSRSDMDYLQLQAINGIDKSCRIMFHDARPDNSARSTEARMAEAIEKALSQITHYMNPQAIIVDNYAVEETYFMQTMKNHVTTHDTTLIEMPANGLEKLSWMTKLDSASLTVWNEVTFDILIHATPGASGSLARLLKSLRSADFSSSHVPHITIDLPNKVDPETAELLHKFVWPPGPARGSNSPRQFSVRHRIARKTLTEDESSVRFIESFWPTRPAHSHVLVLSPEAELSPNFFHYLKYSVLEYRYSYAAIHEESLSRLFGISLVSPDAYLEGSGPFEPPPVADDTAVPISKYSFLWQAPNNHAMLIFGGKWIELHDFVSQVLEVQGSTSREDLPELLSQKVMSTRFPAWLEHALRLCRARSYFTLYPSPAASPKMATVHTELQRPPEEYRDQQRSKKHRIGSDEPVILSRGPLLDTMLGGGVLAALYELPTISWDGATEGAVEHEARALKYITEFRQTVGGCDNEQVLDFRVDLFCANPKRRE
ncbi:hypothetical protein MCOR25_009987 [Pyricularia grisea]|uniref:Glycosyltransferase 2 n=1 Tax=Pyricularia grisea TaxID=148305 RepID=A0A6P8B355_PYRGI|nr:uncharacterized protein PgNI_07532 [Pyricularia grisea]KAI6351363.1 hypothetical protein MCOR25_009987 [Pyricularia grisea]TLD09345.1 hypothetical protein PgNI_07532 [Pyricularia grisea]